MYAEGKGQEEVMGMLIEENVDREQITALSERFYQDYLFLLAEKKKQLLKKAEMYTLAGGVLLAGNLILTVMSYLFMSNGNYITFHTLSILGIILLGKGVLDKRSVEKHYASPDALVKEI
jgi:hypothetical protein